ncbi:small subunit ribosomal protein S13e [Nematocida homosporus]|uniref:small subunit ribosomal protein S13e n=1 Tax=Nematocida homosporus TaxID=1912981 RepID=UPI00221ED60B|nr:small subunit ribosomal protein S13e [Nematocida homosporus]KAI5187412.1 small subunit ribosomal protein S13e [Nematocida homosporus]
MHSQGKGISGSTTPYVRDTPKWLDANAEEIEKKVITYAKKGLSISEIGTILRDEYQIGQMKFFSGMKLLFILMKNNLAPVIPEDLSFLVKKAINIRKHLESNKQDKDSKYRLILVESRISRLARYYKEKMMIPANWNPPYRAAVKRNSRL